MSRYVCKYVCTCVRVRRSTTVSRNHRYMPPLTSAAERHKNKYSLESCTLKPLLIAKSFDNRKSFPFAEELSMKYTVLIRYLLWNDKN